MQRYQRKPRWKTRKANDNFFNCRKFVHVYLGNSGGQRVERLLSPKILLWRSFLDYSESHDPTLMHFLQISCCGCIGRYLVFCIQTRITPLKICFIINGNSALVTKNSFIDFQILTIPISIAISIKKHKFACIKNSSMA